MLVICDNFAFQLLHLTTCIQLKILVISLIRNSETKPQSSTFFPFNLNDPTDLHQSLTST